MATLKLSTNAAGIPRPLAFCEASWDTNARKRNAQASASFFLTCIPCCSKYASTPAAKGTWSACKPPVRCSMRETALAKGLAAA
eukprot:4443980-Pyramimonas_sp.AAC.1